jgi:hypothetical protein
MMLTSCQGVQQEDEKASIRIGISLYRGDDTFINNIRGILEEKAKEYERENDIKVTLDIQDAQIDPDSLETFQGQETAGKDILAQLQPDEGQINQAAEYTAAALQAASRPLFLVGHGLKASSIYSNK